MGDFFRQLNIKNFLAMLALAGCLAVVAGLIHVPIPQDNKDLFNILAVLFFRETLGRVMNWYFPTKEEIKAKQA